MTLKLRTERLSWVTIDGEIVALDAQASQYLGANRSGRLLWQKLVAGATREELVDELAAGFGIEQATAEPDVDRFVEQLREADLLEEI